MRHLLWATLLGTSLCAPLAAQEDSTGGVGDTIESISPQSGGKRGTGALLRALDKVSGKTVDIDMQSGATGQIFNLWVALSDCRYPGNNPTGDAYAFLTINEEGAEDLQFQGWMVASSPALNALDHPRYDVWVIRCTTS